MKRILISAYAVSPKRGSECAVGWEITRRLGKHFDVTVLMCYETPSKSTFYKEIIEYIYQNGEIINTKYLPVKMPILSSFYTWLHDIGFWPAYYWSYKTWQHACYKKAKELHSQNPFDMAYQLNMIGFREPGYLWRLNIPFVWGPTNGFHNIPFSFIKCFKGKEFLFQSLKHIANKIQIDFAYRARKAAKKASIVWCVDKAAYKVMKVWSKNVMLMQETGLNSISKEFQLTRHYDGKRTLNIVCSGMITTSKAYFIVIESLLQLKDKNFHLAFLGDGPLKENLIKKAEPIKEKITWLGWVQRTEVIETIKMADILIHPSLKEGTSMTILEALGMGIPVICHDTCGMGEVINDKNGFKIPYNNRQTSVEYIAKLLQSIILNPDLLNDRYKTIWDMSNDLTWENKVKKITEKINSILN